MSSLGDAAVGPRATLLDRALVRRDCPVCGSTDDRVFAEASFAPSALDEFAFSSRKLPEYMHCRIVSCERCDLLYASPGPTREFLEAAYREASFDASDESRFASVTYGRLVRKFVDSFPDRQGALDIGTGDGAFLHVHAIVNRYPLYYWTKLAPLPKAVKTKLLRSLRSSPLGRMPVSIPVGNMAVIGYKR
jgi:hypothetical protein